MELAQKVKTFYSAYEHILSDIDTNRPLTTDEAAMIEYYCCRLWTVCSSADKVSHVVHSLR